MQCWKRNATVMLKIPCIDEAIKNIIHMHECIFISTNISLFVLCVHIEQILSLVLCFLKLVSHWSDMNIRFCIWFICSIWGIRWKIWYVYQIHVRLTYFREAKDQGHYLSLLGLISWGSKSFLWYSLCFVFWII